ncbi:hypothetical protein [uncultured Christiangramia sp.]|uniref:hypothetical protein n=1 Tax=Christiangramia sp. 3-2217-3z TaxID=3417564 RepID=UPI00260B3B72|nr:hypothetical protein [uncultured Christiangramia sp.]
MKEIIDNYEAISTLVISFIALIISIIALYYTARSFLLKSGHKIRSDISTVSDIDTDEIYISSVTLENLKDRATVIFSIYLKMGRGNYLEIENFNNRPLILKPFEVYYKEYDPVVFYSTGVNKVSISKLIYNRKIKKKILLSTTKGKYTVKTNINRWQPILKLFNNHYTALINPIRYTVKGKGFGNRIRYVLIFKNENGDEEIIKINDKRESLLKFKKFTLTKESLESSATLKAFLDQKKEEQKIKYESLEIVDFQNRIEQISEQYDKGIEKLEKLSFWDYNIKGWIYTKIDDYKLERKNRQNRRKVSKSK